MEIYSLFLSQALAGGGLQWFLGTDQGVILTPCTDHMSHVYLQECRAAMPCMLANTHVDSPK